MFNVLPHHPGFLQISKMEDKSLAYINQQAANFFYLDPEEVKAMKGDFVGKYVHLDTIQTAFPRIDAFVGRGDNSGIHTEFQKVSRKGNGKFVHLITSVKPIVNGESLVLFSVPVLQLGSISHKIIKVLEEDILIRKHLQYFNSLSKRGRKLPNSSLWEKAIPK